MNNEAIKKLNRLHRLCNMQGKERMSCKKNKCVEESNKEQALNEDFVDDVDDEDDER